VVEVIICGDFEEWFSSLSEGEQDSVAFYGFDGKRRAVLLTGDNKSGVPTTRFYRQLIARCETIWDKHKTCE
jgi:hypothetical protein